MEPLNALTVDLSYCKFWIYWVIYNMTLSYCKFYIYIHLENMTEGFTALKEVSQCFRGEKELYTDRLQV